MASLSALNDKQNLLLTQLSYESDVLKDTYNGMTLEEIALVITDKDTKDKLQALCDAGLGSLRIKEQDLVQLRLRMRAVIQVFPSEEQMVYL